MQVGLDKACPSELTEVQKPKTKGKNESLLRRMRTIPLHSKTKSEKELFNMETALDSSFVETYTNLLFLFF